MHFLLRPAAAAALALAFIPSAFAEDLIFMLDNQSSYDVREFYASPSDVGDWEEDILDLDILPAGDALRVTIADGRDNCEYDLRIVFTDDDMIEDRTDLCETGSYTLTD